jgi:hypothetical protein
MADIGNIKPTGPIWPAPTVEKVKQKEERSQQQQQQRHDPTSHKDEENGDKGIDEYV